jgi:inorganic triphosphatase YgiF
LREAEIELIDGNPRGLYEMARALFPEGGLVFSRLSKGERGYLLAEQGLLDPPLEPRNAEAVALHRSQIAEQAVRDILRECFDQITMNMTVVQKLEDPEGPHQLRIGLRRLRSAFSVFSGVLASPEMTRLNDEAREVGQAVGRLRDLDVATSEIIKREADAHPEEAHLSVLALALRRRADGMREQVRGILVGARTQTLLIDLAQFVQMRGWVLPEDFGQTARLGAPLSQLAEDALNKRWQHLAGRPVGAYQQIGLDLSVLRKSPHDPLVRHFPEERYHSGATLTL